MRPGVLVSIVFTTLCLWASVRLPWWSASADLGGFRESTVDLAGFGASAFAWCVAVACLAYAVAAVPVPRRLGRAGLYTGLTATAGAVAVWVVLLVRVLRRDADTHRGWAAEIWARQVAGGEPPLVRTDSDGIDQALIIMFLLLTIGCVLAIPRRHGREVLLVAAMINIVAALTTSTVALWVTTGPGTVERDWVWMPGLLGMGPASIALVVLVPIIGAGLWARPGGRFPRGGRIAWAVTASISCYVAPMLVIIDTSNGPPLYLDAAPEAGGLPAGWGIALTGLLILVIFLPPAVIFAVLSGDAATVRRAAGKTIWGRPTRRYPQPGPVPDDPVPAPERL